MEENKNCCGNKECGNGNCSMHCAMHKCCAMGKCHMMRKFLWFILLLVVFCLGAQFGELKSEARGERSYRGEMMNWRYKNVQPLTEISSPSTTTNTPVSTTPTPAVKQ